MAEDQKNTKTPPEEGSDTAVAEAEPTEAEPTEAEEEQTTEVSEVSGDGADESTLSEEAPTVENATVGSAAVEEAPASETSEGEVSRMLTEAVEAASKEVGGFPTSDDVDVEIVDEEEPVTSGSTEDLAQRGDDVGFTGEIQGRVVTLDELLAAGDEAAEDPTYDQFRRLVEQSSSDVREQEIVEGRVLSVNGDDVVIDIGYKSDGIVDRGEFGDIELGPGDTVEVYLEYKEDWDGQLVLSKTKADKVRRWQRVEDAYANEEILEGTIVRRIKGGMIVDLIEGLEAFLPGSQIDVRPVRDFDAYLEKRMEFKIVKLNPENENIVVSHRALIQKELEEQRKKILGQLEVGQVLQGMVKNIVDFGVFIDLGGVDGLLHITDLSWGRVSHPSEVVDLDEEIEVVVLDYEEERQRISLGLKQLQPHPWEDINEKYDEGEVVEGKVVSITNYGAFVELEKGIEGLVHISEMSWTRHIKHPSQMVSLGQLVDVEILNIDAEGQKISLGMKQLEPDPWEGISDRYPPGTVMRGTIRNITHFGVFVEIEPGIDGLVHISDLSWTKKVRHPKEVATKGNEMDVVILNIDEDRRRISLGHKQVETNPWKQFSKVYAEGEDTTGTVERVEEKGIVVELPLEVEAFVPGSELKHGPRGFQDYYQDGDELDLQVIRFDQGRKDIVVSETVKERTEERTERRQERQAEREERSERERSARQYQDQPRSATGPTTLGELSGLGDLKAQMEAAEAQAPEGAAPEEAAPEESASEEPASEEPVPEEEAVEDAEEEAVEDAEEEAVTEETPEAPEDDVPEGGEVQEETTRTTPEDEEGAELVTGPKASQQLSGEAGVENRERAGKRQPEGAGAQSNTEPAPETARRRDESGDLPSAEGAQAALKGAAETSEKEGVAAAAEDAVEEEETPVEETVSPEPTTESEVSAEEVESFVDASGEEAVTTEDVKEAGEEKEEKAKEG